MIPLANPAHCVGGWKRKRYKRERKGKKKKKKNQSPKGNMWSAIPVALLCMLVIVGDG